MIFINKKQKQILKWIFVAVIIGIIVYTFRDSAGPILEELKKTSIAVILLICVSSVAYELVEGWITYRFAKQYNPAFTYRQGVESAFYCSFYRTATLGSGAGVAAVYYFNEKGIPVSKGTGMYMIEYVLHKLSIAIFSIIFFFISFSYMIEHFGEYSLVLLAGYAVTILIAVVLVAVCCSVKLHKLILMLVDRFNRKHKFDDKVQEVRQQFAMLEEATEFLLHRKTLIAATVLKNLLKLAFWYGIPFFVFYGSSNITLLQTFAITSLSVMLAAVLPAPGGIGSTEFMFTLLFSVIVGTDMAGAASLLYRFATFVFPFAMGAVIVVVRRIRKRV